MPDSMFYILRLIQSLSSPLLDFFLTVFNMLSQQYFLVLLVAVVYWIVDKDKGEHLAASLIFTVCLSCGIKGAVCLPRPFTYADKGINVMNGHTAPGYSFPSADSAAASTVATTFYRRTKSPRFRTLLVIYTLLIGFCRMYFGLHFPTDVLFGYLIGFCISSLIGFAMLRLKSMSLFYSIAAIVLLSFSFFPDQQKDYYNSIGLMLGAVFGILIEHRFVNFGYNIGAFKKTLRLGIGLICLLAIALTCHFTMPDNNMFYVLDKFLLTFFATGIYPAIFKKLRF